jgi:subtilisin family serine protease
MKTSFSRFFSSALVVLAASQGIGVRGHAQHRAHLSDDLLRHEAQHSTGRVNVIVPGSRDAIASIANDHHLTVVKWLATGAVVSANSGELTELASDAGVDNLSADHKVRVGMTVSNQTMAADQTRAGTPGRLLGLGGIAGVTGQGIGVAVIDSGIAAHTALKNKVVANISFVTGDPSVNDAYGHGTHVAGIIAGSATGATPLYTSGIAPGVQLVNVRVLGADGTGFTSDVIAGIDWAVANRARYNIRVINLSLGHPVDESSSTDPLCLAVQRAVNAGVVVVVAAGNQGRAPNLARELGGITSPGNSPDALTVGSINTWGTPTRDDDAVADYSSRGPTRYDFAMKPDVVAPGSAIVSLEAAKTSLISRYPFLHRAGSGSNAYMQLSGTSMAAPMVSGAAALLLQGVPGLSPAQIKLALQSGATYMKDGGLVGGGAGSVNVWTSRQITANGLTSLLTSVTSALGLNLGQPSGPSGASFWDRGSLSGRLYNHTGIRLLSLLDLSRIWSNPLLLNTGDLNLVGLANPLAQLKPNPMMYGGLSAGMDDDDQIIWGTTVQDENGQDVVWGTDDNDQIIWGTNEDPTLTSTNPQ